MRRPGRQHDGAIVARASRTRASMRHVAGSAAARGRRTSSSSVCRGAGNINRCNKNELFSRHGLGNSHGRYDGDTLVVETTNFTSKTPFEGETDAGHRVEPSLGQDRSRRVVERLTRVSASALRYQFTVDEPSVFTRPFSGELTMQRTPARLYEYACHEGNYAIADILRGARATERER